MERIRDLLVAYPDLARMYAEPFPADEPASDDADYVSDAELDRRWGALQSRLGNDAGDADAGRTVAPPPEQGRVLPFRHFPSLAAAALALIFAGLYWQAESRLRQVRAERAEPWVLAEPQQV
ncbi:MAG TPA: hypothetical protein VE010_10130, partial [Thermoanaerobaculia bacterium]|nr:hypothetical protein [Thermoanaerobaculia bacterium]